MKRYVSGFLFFLFLTTGCLLTLFWMTRELEDEEAQRVQATETFEPPLFAESKNINAETEAMLHVVLNQDNVSYEVEADHYYLVAEDGYLIVYNEDKESIHLFTHMPLAEFPISEQERLMDGIWFPTMAEIFSYLESYSS